MSRPFYQQEPLAQRPIFYQRPVNIKRLRHPAGGVYGRSYSLEEQEDLQQQQQQHHHQENVVPVYQKFIYANQRHSNQLPLYQLGDSLSSLDSDFVDDYTGPYIVEQPVSPPPAPKVVQNLNALGWLLDLLQHWPLPSLSFNTACICALIIIFLAPRTCAQSLLFPAFRLFFGTLYPAYASYKAVRTKNVKEYVKWMMYWIVFAFFTCIETFTDIFISWFPFYYEVKVVLVFWLLSPATKGSSTLYRKFVHPMLTRHEQEIDEYLTQAKERGYTAVLQLGSKGVKYATNVIMQTAVKGGGNLVQTIKRSYSLSDLSEPDMHRTQDELDEVMRSSMSSSVVMRTQPTATRLLRPRNHTPVGRSASGTRHSTGMYFTEVDVTAKNAGDFNYNIRSQDDISSGYSSAEPISGLSRTSSMTNASKGRVKSKRNELLEEMRDEVYLENQLYFQGVRQQEPEELQGLDHMERITHHELDEEQEDVDVDPDEVEDDFYEALPLLGADEAEKASELELLSCEEPKKEEPFEETTHDAIKEEPTEHLFPTETTTKTLQTDASTESKLTNELPSVIDPFLLVIRSSVTETDSIVDPEPSDRSRPVSPRELRDTLEEIKHSFRAQLESELQLSPSPSPSLRPRAVHGKGRAPPPPLPPKRHSLSPQPDAISQTSTGSVEQRKSGIGQLFQNIKANVLRNKANPSQQAAPDEPLAGRETEI
ncbi:uncharacterized protein LOC117891292 isoform X2 [Drosophila subobscura]|uniref:uncharacterized protein LOC117891292 isoform X2 n=1 Tax=Drosophila subobscura TaxID=7241 RepID=UPI00155ACCC8|nr:uncharacterized protein LOC117891292 isoform X2 [Drosophila subobscura]